jgi:anti-sigma regulatory factor (Ser/Thr protein kinase)
VQAFCRDNGVSPATADDAVLITSELIGNAYLHARSPTRLRLSCQGQVLRVEVADSSDSQPVLGRGAPADHAGRGVLIMDALAQRWGVRPQVRGKVVWFELAM